MTRWEQNFGLAAVDALNAMQGGKTKGRKTTAVVAKRNPQR